MTSVARPVLVLRTSVAAANAINILVTLEKKHYLCTFNIIGFVYLARVFGEINTGTKHSSYVGVSLIETFLDYRLLKGKIGKDGLIVNQS